jgi:hypothetical protein
MKAFLFSFTMPMLCQPDVSVKDESPSTRLPPEAGKQDERHGEEGRWKGERRRVEASTE